MVRQPTEHSLERCVTFATKQIIKYIVERNIRTCCTNRLLWCITLLQLYCNAFTFLLIGFTINDTRNVLFTRHCIYCAIDTKYFDLHLH